MSRKTRERVLTVLERIADQVRESDEGATAEVYSDALNEMLDELACEDFFGTEGQGDPRGDGRNGDWSMRRVEGVDA